ncbi:protein AMN1 homolog [Homarus americanus]|nr:protein AMN1 homolog [Homarus americanus]
MIQGSTSRPIMQPQTLQELCLDEACLIPTDSYTRLPWTLKDQLLKKLTRRGKCTDDIFSWLIHSRVTELDLHACLISDAGVEYLKTTKCLKVLYMPEPPVVENNNFSENSLMGLGEGKSMLRVVALNGLCGVTDGVIGSLVGGCPQLQEVHISSTSITNHALTALANLTQLVCLNIGKTQV